MSRGERDMKQKLPRATEQRNPRTRGLGAMSTTGILRAIHREDAAVAGAVGRALPSVARAVEAIVAALSRGGRVFYVGAGTSGRLGQLDAAECPPTFGIPARLFQAVVAGGRRELWGAVEAAEDSQAQGARDMAAKRISSNDVVVGLTASGSTPYVLGALGHAKRRGASTIGVTCNRKSPIARLAGILIAPAVGPEVLAGSTRLKAGTAQKLVLNMLSTAALVRSGYVYENWMVNVSLANRKLRARGLGILQQATGAGTKAAREALRRAKDDLRVALVMLTASVGAQEARERLRVAGGDLRRAMALDEQERSPQRRRATRGRVRGWRSF
jgi:N-acetylmuramic acid 6-phosphate etherase